MKIILIPDPEEFQPRNEIMDPEHYEVDGEQLQKTGEEETMEDHHEREEEERQEDMVHIQQVEEDRLLRKIHFMNM